MNPKYNLSEINQMLKTAAKNGIGFYEKWDAIAAHYGVKRDTVRKWFYRNQDKKPSINPTGKITSDQWRTAYFILTGKSSRDKIRSVKAKIRTLMSED
jgi:hypothetical protein